MLGPGAVTSAALCSGAVTSSALGSEAVLPANVGTVPVASLLIGNNFSNAAPTGTFQRARMGRHDLSQRRQHLEQQRERPPPAGAGGYRFIGISVNSGCCAAASNSPAASGVDTMQNVGELLHLNAGDSVTLDVEQTSGTTLSIASTGVSYIAMHWVGS